MSPTTTSRPAAPAATAAPLFSEPAAGRLGDHADIAWPAAGPQRRIRPSERPGRAARGEAVGVEACWATHADEVAEAQRLRYQVFVQELGARPARPASAPVGHDVDLFDAHCEHLLLRPRYADGSTGAVIGTYRVLTANASRRTGGFYSDTEFDLTRLRPLRPRLAELGRACVQADWRAGTAMMVLWSALGEFMQRNGVDAVIGCASVGLHDGGQAAASLWHRLRRDHLAPIECHVRPRLPLPVESDDGQRPVETPPLLRAYLRCGARLLGPPAWDADFNTADLPLMMRLADLPERYRRHFLGT